MDSAKKPCSVNAVPAGAQVLSVSPSSPESDTSDFWQTLRLEISGAATTGTRQPAEPPAVSPMEVGVSIITTLQAAPPRTLHSASIVRSSPLSSSVRAMLERREFDGATTPCRLIWTR